MISAFTYHGLPLHTSSPQVIPEELDLRVQIIINNLQTFLCMPNKIIIKLGIFLGNSQLHTAVSCILSQNHIAPVYLFFNFYHFYLLPRKHWHKYF